MTKKAVLAIAAMLLLTGCSQKVSGPNQPPVAVAGPDVTLSLHQHHQVRLDGSHSYDPDGDPLLFQWDIILKPSGDPAELTDPTGVITHLTPYGPGIWLIALTVNDLHSLSNRDIVRIEITGIPCSDDDECDNGLYCDGTEICDQDLCMPGEPPDCDDADPCTRDTCSNSLSDCEHTLVPIPGAEGPKDDPTCSDELDNDCDGRTDHEDENCATCETYADCDDQNPCTQDFCENEVCEFAILPSGADCDDGLYCNGLGKCNSQGVCTPTDQSPCMETCLTDCDENNDICLASPIETPCESQGLDCTLDLCDGQGACINIPQHDQCNGQALCLPECALDQTGCVDPPGNFDLECQQVEGDPHQAECEIDNGGVVGQENCLSCRSQIIQTVLNHTDFTEDGQSCHLEGWRMVEGEYCSDLIVNCVPLEGPFGNWVECRTEFEDICSMQDGAGVLTTDVAAGVGLRREWRIFKSFNTLGYRDLELCFDVSENNADDNDWLLATVYNDDHPLPGSQLLCLNHGQGIDDNNHWYRICRDLPIWANDKSEIFIAFVGHSHEFNQTHSLTNITLRGFSDLCPAGAWIVMTETFEGCTDPLPADWNDWEIQGSATCGGFPECYQDIPNYDGTSVEAENQTVTMTKRIDVSTLGNRISVCFRYGTNFLSSSDSLEFLFDSGSGWTSAYWDSGQMGEMVNTCRNACVNLSDLDPQVDNNPDLGIRFQLIASTPLNRVNLADIRVQGYPDCDGSDHLFLDPPEEQDGDYEFTLSNDTNNDLTVKIQCEWDSTIPPTRADAVVRIEAK